MIFLGFSLFALAVVMSRSMENFMQKWCMEVMAHNIFMDGHLNTLWNVNMLFIAKNSMNM